MMLRRICGMDWDEYEHMCKNFQRMKEGGERGSETAHVKVRWRFIIAEDCFERYLCHQARRQKNGL